MRQTPSPEIEAQPATKTVPQIRQVATLPLPTADAAPETLATPTGDLPITNAAVLYRQAFALYDALSDEQKAFIDDPKTNIDAAAEAELCEKVRPICDLMHQATALTNCDWEVPRPYTADMKFTHFKSSRQLARTANWSASHCHNGDSAGAVTDLVAASHLGRSFSSQFLIGWLVDAAIQGLIMETLRDHAGSWRLTGEAETLFDPDYGAKLSGALSQEADILSDVADQLATRPADEAVSNLNVFAIAMGMGDKTAELQQMGAAQGIAYLRQYGDAVREYGEALRLSESDFQKWQESIGKTNDFLALAISQAAPVVERMQRATITAKMTQAGLAIIRDGPDALQSYLDPATGNPFVYTQTDDGFELESGYQVNGQPLRLKFK